MSTPPSKRAKPDTAAALLRPFKSPLPNNGAIVAATTPPRSAPTAPNPHSNSSSSMPQPSLSNKPGPQIEVGAIPTAQGYNQQAYQTPLTQTPPSGTRAPPPSLTAPSPATSSISTHLQSSPSQPEPGSLRGLQSESSALLRRLTSLRNELDTAKQAVRLEQSGRDAELEGLIIAWRRASQDAAEELFAAAKDRVNAMGGVRAFRERERERKLRWAESWGGDGEGGDKGEEDGSMIEERNVEELEGEIDGTQKQSLDADEGDTFTMDMMLRSLGIDAAIIGFDREGQQWVEL